MLVPLGVGDFLDRGALVYGDRIAVVDEPGVPGSWGSVTYAELQRRAWGMARALSDLGVPPGARVAIVSPNAARFLCSLECAQIFFVRDARRVEERPVEVDRDELVAQEPG